MNIPYETSNGAICTTPCPFGMSDAYDRFAAIPDTVGGAPLIRAVGSSACRKCQHFICKNTDKSIECNAK